MHVAFRRHTIVWGSDDARVRVRAPEISYLGGSGGSEVHALVAPGAAALTVEGSGRHRASVDYDDD